jgi:hypothetical protein
MALPRQNLAEISLISDKELLNGLRKRIKDLEDNQEKHKSEDLKPTDLPPNWKTELARIPGLESNQKPTDYDTIKNGLKGWTDAFGDKKPSDITNRMTNLEKRPDIPITKEQWENDYQNRPTRADFNKEKRTRIEKENDLIKERNESKQLEDDNTKLTTDLTNLNKDINTLLTKWKAKDLNELSTNIQTLTNEKDKNASEITKLQNDISQKEQTIKSLKLKNEKLTDNQKKLYGYLGEAWKLISHLQKDLQTEKQDKIHIQQELNEALTILNKPTAEMGTQTDLTVEQITQMKKDLEYFRKLLYQGAMEIERLEKELSEIEQEKVKTEQTITKLQAQVKDLTPNEQEKSLLKYCELGKWGVDDYPNIKKGIESLSNLREDYLAIKSGLLSELVILTRKVEIEKQNEQKNKELASKNKNLSDLQTKYDMEVKTKKEVVEELQKEKGWWDKWINDDKTPIWQSYDEYNFWFLFLVGGEAVDPIKGYLHLISSSSKKIMYINPTSIGWKDFTSQRLYKERLREITYNHYKNKVFI